jgi:hypothetical protein
MTNSSSFPLTVRVTAYISFFMQSLPVDRKSPGRSTLDASPAVARERPHTGVERAAAAGEIYGNLAKFVAAGRSPLGALAGRLEQLGRDLLRLGVEPLAYTAGLLSRLLHQSRRLMGMGHRRRPRQDSLPKDNLPQDGLPQDSPARTRTRPRKTHRLQALYGVRGQASLARAATARFDRDPAACDRTRSSSRRHSQRRPPRYAARTSHPCAPPCPPSR